MVHEPAPAMPSEKPPAAKVPSPPRGTAGTLAWPGELEEPQAVPLLASIQRGMGDRGDLTCETDTVTVPQTGAVTETVIVM